MTSFIMASTIMCSCWTLMAFATFTKAAINVGRFKPNENDSFPLSRLTLTRDRGPVNLMKRAAFSKAITEKLQDLKNYPSIKKSNELLSYELALLSMYSGFSQFQRELLEGDEFISEDTEAVIIADFKAKFPETVQLTFIDFISFPVRLLTRILTFFHTTKLDLTGSKGITLKDIESLALRRLNILNINEMNLPCLPCLVGYKRLVSISAANNTFTRLDADRYFQHGKYVLMPYVESLRVVGCRLNSVCLNICEVFPNAVCLFSIISGHNRWLPYLHGWYHISLKDPVLVKKRLNNLGVTVLLKRRPESSTKVRARRSPHLKRDLLRV